MAFSNEDKLKAVRREIGFRERVYGRRVAERKMTQDQMDREIGVFRDIAEDYDKLASAERLL